MHFRNKAIRAEKYFRKSSGGWQQKEDLHDEKFEPEVRIKLEDDEELERVKSEPFDDDPNHELLANIDSMIGNHNSHLNSVPFVDVFSSNREVKCEQRKKKSKNSDFEDYASSSGVVRCNLCLKSFTSVNSHHNHMKTVHREMSESEMHKCKFCNRFFKLKIYLNRHAARIHGTKTKSGKPSKRKGVDSIFNKEDVSLYCEVRWTDTRSSTRCA